MHWRVRYVKIIVLIKIKRWIFEDLAYVSCMMCQKPIQDKSINIQTPKTQIFYTVIQFPTENRIRTPRHGANLVEIINHLEIEVAIDMMHEYSTSSHDCTTAQQQTVITEASKLDHTEITFNERSNACSDRNELYC